MGQDSDECVESMPGFHEHDERDLDPSQHDEDEDDRPRVTGQGVAASERLGMDMPKLKPRPPVSAPARSFPNANDASAPDRGTGTSTATRVAKPVSTSNAASSPSLRVRSSKPRISKEPLQCPVCDKTILTDNEGLNAHIDFCLSRNAIREAQAESIASSSTKRLKPASQR